MISPPRTPKVNPGRLLPPGHYLHVTLSPLEPARVSEHIYWEIDFPRRGEEDPGHDLPGLVDEFEALMLQAVRRRLQADKLARRLALVGIHFDISA